MKTVVVSAAIWEEWMAIWISPDHGTALLNLSVAATLCALLSVFGPRLAVIGAVVLDAVVTALLIGDLAHVQFFGDVLTSTRIIEGWRMLPIVWAAMTPVWNPWWLLYFIEWPLVVTLAIRAFNEPAYRDVGVRVARILPVIACSAVVWVHSAASLRALVVGIREETALPRAFIPDVGLLAFHAMDLARGPRTADELSDRVANAADVKAYLARLREQQPRASLFGAARGANLIVISAESLQAFPIGRDVRGRAITPTLNELTRESLHFTRFQDQTGLGSTTDAEFGVLHSLHPLRLGTVAHSHADNGFRALPTILSGHGYATVSAVGSSPDVWNMGLMHRRLGFSQTFFQPPGSGEGWFAGWEPDRAFFARAAGILQAQPEPFAAFLLSSSNHYPYVLPDGLPELTPTASKKTTVGRYLDTVHYFDSGLGILLDRLRANGLLDRSVVVVYGDHQGYLGEPAELARLLGFSRTNDWRDFFRIRKAVPLLIRLPHAREAGVRTTAAGHLDVPTTVLSLLGLPADEGVMLGRDLTADGDGLVVFRDGSFAYGDRYHLERHRNAGSDCFLIDTGAPVECGQLPTLRPQALERLRVSDLIIRQDLVPLVVSPPQARPPDAAEARIALQE